MSITYVYSKEKNTPCGVVNPLCQQEIKNRLTEVVSDPNAIVEVYDNATLEKALSYPHNVTLIIPGGSLFGIAEELRPSFEKIRTAIKHGANGVFFCAGAFLSGVQNKLPASSFEYKGETYISPETIIYSIYLNLLPIET